MQIAAQINLYSGALPPPSILESYERVVPGAGERLLRQAESQTRHRQQLERHVTTTTARRSTNGLIAGTIVVLGLEVVAAICALVHEPYLAAFFGMGGPISLAGVFVYGRHEQREERTDKAKIMTKALSEGVDEITGNGHEEPTAHL